MDTLLEILRKKNMLTDSSVRTTLKFMERWSVASFYAVLECHLVTESELADVLSQELKMDRIYNLSPDMIDKSCLGILDYTSAKEMDVMPMRQMGDGTKSLEVVVANPLDKKMIESLQGVVGLKIKPVVSELRRIREMIYQLYPLESQIPAIAKG